jgi:hypothetical protein
VYVHGRAVERLAQFPSQKIEWFKLVDLPNWKRSKQSSGKFYLIAPFIQ